jgi:histidinol-phosphate/aromatic aminotransferase/cobyric acid decarboxylase-like protein
MKAMGENEYYETVIKVIANLEGTGLRALKLNGEKWYEIDDAQDKANTEIIFAKNKQDKLNLIQKRYGGYWRFPSLKDFCYLVNPYFPTKKMQEEMKAYFNELISEYPSGLNTQNLLAAKMFKIDEQNIIVGNGASEIIKGLKDIFDGTFALMFPTFNEYYQSIGLERVTKGASKKFAYTKKDIFKLAKKSDNIILINPDNPSGNFIKKDELLEIAKFLKKNNKTFILDESFVDFSSEGEENSLINQEIIDKYPNLVIIKSISKSYGVPGIRLGVMVTSNKKILQKAKEVLSIWNINSFGEFFLQTIGKYQKDYQVACKKIAQERDRFYKRLQKIDYFNVFYSQANYFLIELKGLKATKLTQDLLWAENIFIKDLTGKIGFEKGEFIRVAVPFW